MKTDPSTRAPVRRAALFLLVCALIGGCRDPQKRRASVEFHADAVRKTMEVLRRVVRLHAAGELKEPHYDLAMIRRFQYPQRQSRIYSNKGFLASR